MADTNRYRLNFGFNQVLKKRQYQQPCWEVEPDPVLKT